MRLVILIVCLVSVTMLSAQDLKLLFWDDLKPQIEFKDPFKGLNLGQLYKLRELMKLRDKETKAQKELTPQERIMKDSFETALRSEKIDFEYIFSNRKKIIEMRRRQYEDLNTTLDNVPIELSGYLLPLNFYKEKANEFLLVPWVGACIHTPPPPKNQIVYVKTKDWMNATSLFEPVLLSGVMRVVEGTSSLFLKDGTSEIETGYSVTDATITKL